ncbi:nucleotide-binding protein [bacterium]|nr:nucleotide-binding protein [bacterium]
MFSLFVSFQIDNRAGSTVDISRNRFLEYTSETISNQLESLSEEAIECLKSWPCVLMNEGRGQEEAYVVEITNIKVDVNGEIKLTISPLSSTNSLYNDDLWKIRAELDIEQFEFSRNHWAIKDQDLFPILEKKGFSFLPIPSSIFQNKALPAPTRSALIGARNVISEWSHTEIDDFLLEAGVSNLNAARSVGSRRDRANAIVEFALANPAVNTEENSMFSAFILRKATLSQDSSLSQVEIEDSKTIFGRLNSTNKKKSDARAPNRVFIVHGQNEKARTAVMEVLTEVGLQGIVLHEQPNMGRHLLTKFIEEAELVTFAVVLMTDDDIGGLKGADTAPRARQNVILELGYFISHLGQQRVCALITPGLETPSDFDGIVYIQMDRKKRWKDELLRELRAAEMPLVE